MRRCATLVNEALLVLGGSTIVGVVMVQAVSALTYQNSVDVDFTINPSLSINLSANDLIINDLTPGSSSDSNIITVDVATNAGYGYYMSATAGTSSTDTNLTNTANSSSVFTNLASNAATLSAFPDNYWGYSYSTDNGSTWISGSQGDTATGYNGLPLDNDDSGVTGVILASTDSLTNASSVKFKIGAKASATQASGTYTNTVNFYAVANPEPSLAPVACNPGKVCYNANSLTTTEGEMGKQNASDGVSIVLFASNYSRAGYGFAGWSDTYDYSGNLYGPQETIVSPTGTTANGLPLYAVWVKSAGSMQSDAASVCSRLTAASNVTKTLNSVSALTDERDGNTYAIAKLADGKCWMIENLRLNNTASHNSDGSLAQGYGESATYGNFAGLADAESTTFSSLYVANSLYSKDGSNDTVNIGATDYVAYRMPRYNNTNTTVRATAPTVNNAAIYSYGNYYTWHAAIADVSFYGSSNISATGVSICPSGWHLPTGGDKSNEANSEIQALIVDSINGGTKPANYDNMSAPYYDGAPEGRNASNTLRGYPNNFIYAGYLSSSTFTNRGTTSSYWTSTSGGSNSSFQLDITGSTLGLGMNIGNKSFGRSVRCVVGS